MNNDHYNIDKGTNSYNNLEGQVSWRSPSNIALVKYWGKKAGQLPLNPSISFTLSNAHTTTSVKYRKRSSSNDWLTFRFEGKKEISFGKRVQYFLESLTDIFPFIELLQFEIDSENSFPHSSGIASSASSMSAIALCLCSIEEVVSNQKQTKEEFFKKASFIARLGSGSACRSVYPSLAIWGKAKDITLSDNHIAIPHQDYAAIYQDYHDDILIISGEKKSVSSTAGHKLMDSNPFADIRYEQARNNLQHLLVTLKNGDLDKFIDIVEEEALTLHALMMCSRPSYTLMKPNTLAAIERIRDYRLKKNVPIAFTLDAGPNIHVLYPHQYVSEVKDFIKEELMPLTESNLIIEDQVGTGPIKLS